MSEKEIIAEELVYSDGEPSGKYEIVIKEGHEYRTAPCCINSDKEHCSKKEAYDCYNSQ